VLFKIASNAINENKIRPTAMSVLSHDGIEVR
jgi:hypothetical protein